MTLLSLSTEVPINLNLSDKTYLITGAANGIGRALSIALSDLSATVILLDKDDAELNVVYDQINTAGNGEPIIALQDLTLLTQSHCDSLVTQIQQSFGKLDGLVHCAAETGHLSPIEHYAEEDWSKIIQANLHSAYLLTRSLMPLFSGKNENTVIFSLSQQALKSNAFWGAFAVAQQGLKALVETWSEETENSNTSFIMIDPGKVRTKFLIQLYPGLNPNQYPETETIARAYLHLLANSTANLHGKFIQINELEMEVVN